MKKCPRCSSMYDDSISSCPNCGYVFGENNDGGEKTDVIGVSSSDDDDATVPLNENSRGSSPQSGRASNQKGNGSNSGSNSKMPIVLAIVGAIILVALVLVILLWE